MNKRAHLRFKFCRGDRNSCILGIKVTHVRIPGAPGRWATRTRGSHAAGQARLSLQRQRAVAGDSSKATVS